MGRYKLPEKTKALRGTQRNDRKIDDSQYNSTSITSLESVKVPKHLKGLAAQIYKERVTQLFAMGMLQPIDVDALTLYATSMATAIKMQKQLDDDGHVTYVKDEDGNVTSVVVNPMFKVLKDSVTMANTIGSQFGWSPVSRVRLLQIAKGEDKKNDFYDLINGKD